MVYMGSKEKYSKFIVPILQKTIDENNITTYIEPFCGGCSIIRKIKCNKKLAIDRSETLIALLQQARDDFSKIPTEGTRAMWDEGKDYVKDGIPLKTMSLADVGAIEFLGSFSNGGFPRGYAKNSAGRNYYNEAYRNLEKDVPELQSIEFMCSKYEDLNTTQWNNCMIYCDPPYKNTKNYSYKKFAYFDYEYFWNWIRELSKNNFMFISEQEAPNDFKVIWEKEVNRTAGKDNNFKAIERLYAYERGIYFNT